MKKQEKIYAENYIDKLIIEKTEEKYLHGKPNDKYGIEFENSIITKSCVNLCVKSINDPNIYTKEYRHFAGIKLLLVKNNYEKKEDISDYITNFLIMESIKLFLIPIIIIKLNSVIDNFTFHLAEMI